MNVLCNNHTCVRNKKCARYTGHYRVINRLTKRFKCQSGENLFIELKKDA